MERAPLLRAITFQVCVSASSFQNRICGSGFDSVLPRWVNGASRRSGGIPWSEVCRHSFGEIRGQGSLVNHDVLQVPVVFHLGPLMVTETVVTTWVLIAALVIACGLATRRMTMVPSGLQALIETLVSGIEQQIRETINHDPSEFLPLLGGLFIFLLVANLSGLLPGVRPPTASIETPAALATIVFFSVHVFGIKLHGLGGYMRSYLKPNPLLLPLNVLSEFTRSFSLMMRLFGNIMSDELVLGILIALAGLFVPIPFMAFEILVAVIQAYIFSVLAAVYIGGAVG
jgi:F-type H+-transporting ATPase subunit a